MKEKLLKEIQVKQGRTLIQIGRALGVSSADFVEAKRELVDDGEIYEHPLSYGLYIKQKSAGTAKPTVNQAKSVTPSAIDLQLREAIKVKEKTAHVPDAAGTAMDLNLKAVKVEPERKKITDDEIIAYLRENGAMSCANTAIQFKRSPQALGPQMHRMVKEGKLELFSFDSVTLFAVGAQRTIPKPMRADPIVVPAPIIEEAIEETKVDHEFTDHIFRKVSAYISEQLISGPKTYEQLCLNTNMHPSDIRDVLALMNKRQKIVVVADGWALHSRSLSRVSRHQVLALFDDDKELTATEIAAHFGRKATSMGTTITALVNSGDLVRVSVSPSVYRRVSDTGVSNALEQIDRLVLKSNEKPKEEWLAIIAKLQQAIGGPTSAVLGEVHGYLTRQQMK